MDIFKARELQKFLSRECHIINSPQSKNYEHIGFDNEGNLIYLVSTILFNMCIVVSDSKTIESARRLKNIYGVDTIIQPGSHKGEICLTQIIRID